MEDIEIPVSNAKVFVVCDNHDKSCKGYSSIIDKCKYYDGGVCNSAIEGVQALVRRLKEDMDLMLK